MNMPGFTAEASLRSTTSVYRAVGRLVSKTDEVQMQLYFCMGELQDVCCHVSDDGYDLHCVRRPKPKLSPTLDDDPEHKTPDIADMILGLVPL